MHSAALTVALAIAVTGAPPDSAPTARTLRGHVTDTLGHPLGQVRVTVLEARRTTLTDLEGRYMLAKIPSGTYGVSFALVGYAPQVLRVSIGEGDTTLDAMLRPTLIELPEMQVTATPLATTSLTSPQPTSLLSREELQTNRAPSLGETVSSMPGVRSFGTGSGIGKPVIRGLSSNRVLVLADGQRVESQQWGDEHGPQVEAGEAERIEVIRGPASVLYGSDALGGVVNVVTPPLPDAIGRNPFGEVRLLGTYSTNNDQPDGTASVEGAAGAWGFRGSFTGRTSEDVRTPAGPLFNSGGSTLNGAANVGYRGSFGTVSASYSDRHERVEIHEDPAQEALATPYQRIADARAHLKANLAAGASHFDLDLGYERNRRREFEAAGATEIALGLLANTYSADVRLHHVPLGPIAGLVGASALRSTLTKSGEESLVPENAYTNIGVYAFEQAEVGRWNLSLGARYDHRRLTVENDEDLGVLAQRRTYNSLTGNLGVLYRAAEPVALVLNVGRGFRAPSAFDLFANGVHEGTVRYERGDSTLGNETSFNTDLALRVQTRHLSAEIGGYVNYIDGFIFPNPTGVEDPGSGFQIYDITQGNARLAGFEAAAEYHPIELLHLRVTADYTRGQNTSTDTPLPFIPPFRATYTVKVEGEPGRWMRHSYLSLSGESNARQTRLDPEDYAPAGYTLGHVGAGTTVPAGRATFAIDLQLRNLFDEAYAGFLSRYKTYALDPGRNLVIQVSTAF